MDSNLKGDLFLGQQIRKKRESIGTNLTQAAKEMNISASFLSQIERGIVAPSINTLRTIADYLNTYIGFLLGESVNSENVQVIRKKEIQNISNTIKSKGVNLHILSPTGSKLEFMYDEFEKDSSTGNKLYQHEGEECAFVLQGKLEIILNYEKIVLNEGDFIWFQSNIPHKIVNLHTEKSIAIWIDCPPRF